MLIKYAVSAIGSALIVIGALGLIFKHYRIDCLTQFSQRDCMALSYSGTALIAAALLMQVCHAMVSARRQHRVSENRSVSEGITQSESKKSSKEDSISDSKKNDRHKAKETKSKSPETVPRKIVRNINHARIAFNIFSPVKNMRLMTRKAWYESTLEKLKKNQGETPHPDVAAVLKKLAEACYQLHKWQKAKEYSTAFLDMSQHMNAYEEAQTLPILKYLGDSNRFLGNWEEAIHFYEKFLKQNSGKRTKEEIAETYWGLGNAYFSLNNWKDAHMNYKKARVLLDELQDPASYYLLFTFLDLAMADVKLKYTESEIDYHISLIKASSQNLEENIEMKNAAIAKWEKTVVSYQYSLTKAQYLYTELADSSFTDVALKLTMQLHERPVDLDFARKAYRGILEN